MKNSRTVAVFMLLYLFAYGTAVLCRGAIRQIAAINVRPGASERIRLRSTDRLPGAGGEVRIERKGGTTEIEVNLGAMKPASWLGGDYNTYVLLARPPGGPAENLGDRALDRTLELWRQRGGRLGIVRQARQTVRLALAAQHLAEGRAFKDARISTEGSGGGSLETGRRNLRDGK